MKFHAVRGYYTEARPIFNRLIHEALHLSSRTRSVLAIVVIAVIWRLPYGQQVLYPFSLLATYAHEMGHGLAALLVGAEFDQLALYANGSGLAQWHGSNPGRLASALVATGGLLGPTVAGVTLLLLCRSPHRARTLLAALAVLILVTLLLWARNPFAIGFLLATSAFFALGARWLPDLAAASLLHFIAALLCLAWFRDLDYMFSEYALVDGIAMPSDSALIAEALILPYWFWGGVIAAISLALLGIGLRVATRSEEGTALKSR